MRFRSKFGALAWVQVGLTCFAGILWFSGVQTRTVAFLGAIFALNFLLQVVSHLFIYWEFGDDQLRERRFWKRNEIALSDVMHVGQWTRNSSYVFVETARRKPTPDDGRIHIQLEQPSGQTRIIANPEDRAGFLSALHRFAPQAQFEV